jgi:hypothetical protein
VFCCINKIAQQFMLENSFNCSVYAKYKVIYDGYCCEFRWRESVGADSITESDYPNQVCIHFYR